MSIKSMEYFLEDSFQEIGAQYSRLTLAQQYRIGEPGNEVIIAYGVGGDNVENYKIYTSKGIHTTITTSKVVLFDTLVYVLKAYNIDKTYSVYLEGV